MSGPLAESVQPGCMLHGSLARWMAGMDGMCIPPVPASEIFWLVIPLPNGGISTWMHAAWVIGWMDGMDG